MTLAHPWWLLVLVPAAVIAVIDATRRWNASATWRAVAIACRAVLVTALACAAAEPRWQGERSEATVVFLIDRSASVADDVLAASWAKVDSLRSSLSHVAVVTFDARAVVTIAPGDTWQVPAELRGAPADRDATNIAQAVRLGLGLIPPDSGGALVLVGDGRGNAGDLTAATSAAVARGIPISTIETSAVAGDPAIAGVVLDADRIHTGATLTGHVEVDAGGVSGPAKLTVKVGDAEVTSQDVTLDGGHQSIAFSYALPAEQKPGVLPVEATLTVASGTVDRDAANDKASARLVVEHPPKVVILDGDDNGAAPLAAALRAEQMDVSVIPAADSGPAPDFGTADLVILANAPVRGGVSSGVIDDEVGKKLVRWVNDGGGLLVLGGPAALDGNYAANRLADALPIEIEPVTPEIDASATVVIILDESGSMGEVVAGQTKLALAAEGAAAVIRLLRSFDHVAVEAVEDRVHWLVPSREIGTDTAMLEQRVKSVEVGGDGIFVYTSLVAARDVLAKATTPLKHIILFSDTTDAAEQVKGVDYGDWYGWPSGPNTSFAIAKQLREKGITLSVIGVGDGADAAFNPATYVDDEDDSDWLRELAKQGGGRYYRTSDAKQLRGLFVQDARKLLDTHAHDEDIMLKTAARHPALDGVDFTKAPKLHGFQEVKPRPAAQVVVTDKSDNPILTRWPYGLGEVAVWASDAGPRWAKDWLAWPGYARFWTQLARSALRRREGDRTAIESDFMGDTATVRVVRRSDTSATTATTVPRARVIEDGKTRELPLSVVEPGVFDAKLLVMAGHEPTIELVDEQGAVTDQRVLTRPASSELRQRGPDTAALQALAKATHGEWAPTSITAPSRSIVTTKPLAPWLLLLALLLVPIDAMLRRMAREPRDRVVRKTHAPTSTP